MKKLSPSKIKYRDPATGGFTDFPYVAGGSDAQLEQEVEQLKESIANYLPKNQGTANVGKILVVGTDGNLTLTEMPEGGASGDVIGTLDESNNILLSGNLADGTYTLKYENTDGTYTEIGTLEVGAIVTYTVTQNLTEVTSDNSVTSVREGESLTLNLAVNDGYELSSIIVTMGGTDISSSAVNGNTITISNVTGNIVITAVAEEIKVVEPVTVAIALTNGIRIGSDGGDRTQVGYCATEHIDLTNIPKPCTINLTKAKWSFATSSETGAIIFYAWKPDGTKLQGGYTSESIGLGYFTLVRNDGKNTDVTVTVTSDEVAKIRFGGWWASSEVRNDWGLANYDTVFQAEATLTYTPES